jgi:hypothetical protein
MTDCNQRGYKKVKNSFLCLDRDNILCPRSTQINFLLLSIIQRADSTKCYFLVRSKDLLLLWMSLNVSLFTKTKKMIILDGEAVKRVKRVKRVHLLFRK